MAQVQRMAIWTEPMMRLPHVNFQTLDCNGDGTTSTTAANDIGANIGSAEGVIECMGEMAGVAFAKGWVFFVAVITILLSIGLLGMGWRKFRGWLSGLSR